MRLAPSFFSPYPRDADGIRFKTDLMQLDRYDTDYMELAVSYWKKIGVNVEIEVEEGAVFGPRRTTRDYRMMQTDSAARVSALGWAGGMRFLPETQWNTSNTDDAWYNAKFEEKRAATTMEEVNSITKELNQYAIEQFWSLFGPVAPTYAVSQPWIIGYNGEADLGMGRYNTVFTRVWIDSELKEAMGH